MNRIDIARAHASGIRASQRPQGWVAGSWNVVLNHYGKTHRDCLARGRTLARRAAVQRPWFQPGAVSATVVDGNDEFLTTIRVRNFKKSEWNRIYTVLRGRLRFIAELMEGRVPKEFAASLTPHGLSLVPTNEDLSGDCDCPDYRLPCAHWTALHVLLADALDGDPFLLFELRGRPRHQLLSELRASWGDHETLKPTTGAEPQAPPSGDWLASPKPLPPLTFKMREPAIDPTGLRALGPAPGKTDLSQTLAPLYDAAADNAMERIRSAPSFSTNAADATVEPQPLYWDGPDLPPQDPDDDDDVVVQEDLMAARRARTTRRRDDTTLTERVVDALSKVESAKSTQLATQLGVTVADVRNELIELEKMGLVYRTGQTRGTHWWLG